MEIKISVIISVYNKLEQLKNILLALNNQIELPFEVLIVDDGSQEILFEKIKDIIPQIKYKLVHVYQEDRGFRLAASRNNGIIHSSGEYLLFIDQDILFDEFFLRNIKKNIKRNETIKFNALFLDKERSEEVKEKISTDNFNFDVIKKLLKKSDYNKIYKKNKLDLLRNFFYKLKMKKTGAKVVGLGIGCFKEDAIAINGFDEKYEGWGMEDNDFGNKLYALGNIVKTICSNNLIVHIWHPENKNKSNNITYYHERKREILNKKESTSEFGCNNRIRKEEIKICSLNME